jgi:hypothetical protein
MRPLERVCVCVGGGGWSRRPEPKSTAGTNQLQLTPGFILEPVELDLDGIRPMHQREELVRVQRRRPAPRGALVRRSIPLLAAVGHLRSEPRRFKSAPRVAAPSGRVACGLRNARTSGPLLVPAGAGERLASLH